MSDSIDMLLRVFLGFVTLLFFIRIIGNKQLGQLNIFTYISGIVIGSMIADTLLHKNLSMWRSILGVSAWVGLLLFMETMSLKSVRVRELLDGQPIILVKRGKIIYDALKKERMNIDDLTMLLRTNMVFSILDVDYAILEPNGDLSILQKQEKETVKKEDLQISTTPKSHLPTSMVMDGRIITRNLVELGLSEEYLSHALNTASIQHNDILYAELQGDEQLHIQLYNGKIQILNMKSDLSGIY